MQDKLDAWDPSKADDVQYLMNMAKKYVILDTLVANGGKCTYSTLFERADEVSTHHIAVSSCAAAPARPARQLHCDVLAAAVKSLKKSKAVTYEGRAQSRSNRSSSQARQPTGPLHARRDATDADEQGRRGRAGR